MQILDQNMWTSLIPKWLISLSGLSAVTIVLTNGIAEVILGIMLAIGIKVRIVAILLSLHLLSIIMELGISAIGVRDIGLFFATTSIALNGPDMFSFEYKKQIN